MHTEQGQNPDKIVERIQTAEVIRGIIASRVEEQVEITRLKQHCQATVENGADPNNACLFDKV